MFAKTLVCLDGSGLAEQILPYVAESCQGSSSEIILLQVITSEITIPPRQSIYIPPFVSKPAKKPSVASEADTDMNPEPEVDAQFSEIAEEEFESKRYLEGIARPLRKAGLKVKTAALEGDVVQTVLDYASHNKVTAIALTTHGSGGLKHGTLGKVTQAILKGWNLPVLVIKPTASEQS